MPSLTSGALRVCLFSLGLTLVISWPVWRFPDTQIFGHEIVGRHYDPFVVMHQFATGGAAGAYRQPLTDDVGVALARVIGPIAAYNLLVLLSFPLTALATYLLARHLTQSHGGALVAALAFAFAPVRLAQASYHVHIAQTQWIPLYLLALFRAVDRPTVPRLLLLVLAVACLALSNSYGGLIGALVTPVALVAYWLSRRPLRWRGFWGPVGALLLTVILAVVIAAWALPGLIRAPQQFAFPLDDLARYGARWWAYFVPPADHPFLGDMAMRASSRANVGVGLLEQQLSIGWGLLVLAALGVLRGLWPIADGVRQTAVGAVIALGVWAFVVSLAPASPGCTPGSIVPACLVHHVLPMFRAYARIGIVTNLCVALLAGYAVAWVSSVRGGAKTIGTSLAAAALIVATVEAWPLPGRARDVLPTRGHRWLTTQPAPVRALDCGPSTMADATLPWLMQQDVQWLRPPMFEACDEPGIVDTLAARGFTHVIARVSPPTPYSAGGQPPGLEVAASFPDAMVYRVAARPAVATVEMRGFYDWERSERGSWRWMGPLATWTVVNTTTVDQRSTLRVALESFDKPRQIAVTLDGRALSFVVVSTAVGEHVVGPFDLTPGSHEIQLRSIEPAVRPADVRGTSDGRPLTVAIHRWSWSTQPTVR